MNNNVTLPSGKKLIAIYDMDKTVTRRATYNGFLAHMAPRGAPWRLLLLPFLPFGLLLYALKIWSRSRLKEFSLSLFIGGGIHQNEYAKFAESYAKQVIGNNVYPQFITQLAAEKTAGYSHVLATASYRLYVDAIAAKLGFDYIIATDLVIDDGGYVRAQIDGDNCYDTAKLAKVEQWMAKNNLKRGDCYIRAYSDHVSDAPLLRYADEAYATNPHPPLAEMAKAKGWQILDWR
jgi:HAD superfamily hydrolase (TIGR01490 family)